MIYCTDSQHGEVSQPLDWKLYSRDQHRIRLNSEEELREYLKGHADEDFWLVPGPFLSREMVANATAFDAEENIRCGIVRYDSQARRILTRDGLKVDYSHKIKQSNEVFALLQQATKRLEEVLGASASWVMAAWDRPENTDGRSVFTLRICDWIGEVSASFTPEELSAYSQDRYPWRRLWGDLLQIRSHKQLEAVMEATGAGAR